MKRLSGVEGWYMPVRPDLEVAFADPDLPDRLEAMSPAMIDTLPFGVVLLDRRNDVLLINRTERSNAALDDGAIGRGFFSAVAPHFDDDAFRGQVEAAVSQHTTEDAQGKSVSLAFAVPDSAAVDTSLQVRVHGATQGGLWIVFDRQTGAGDQA